MAKSTHVFLLIMVLHVLKSSLVNNLSSLSHDDECSLLFKFKESMSIKNSSPFDSHAYPKVASWNLNGSDAAGNCCLWDGVACRFGHVIGLDVSNSFLSGPISSNNSLFSLIHLRRLNLAHNDFSFSRIPSGIGRLSQLVNLNLSYSWFGGEVPKQVSQLRNLVSLDLTGNWLTMQGYDFQNLVQNSSETLRELILSGVSIDSELPASIGNLTHLNILDLTWCGFRGILPASISNLTQLTLLSLSYNKFIGSLPSLESFSNLTYLSLSENNFDRWRLPNWFGKLKKITYLDSSNVNMYGELPSSFFNLTQVGTLYLSENRLEGQLSSSLLNLQNLETFDLGGNNMTVDFYLFLSLKELKYLYLSGNNVTFSVLHNHKNETQPKLIDLRLTSCNLKVFPPFLRSQHQLEYLYLDNNTIEGLVPGWMWNMSKETLNELSLAQNFLTGFERHSPVALWVKLRIMDLSHNILHGPIPVPLPSTMYFSMSNNMLTGDIPSSICDLRFLQYLDLSFNNITGSIPPCLEKLSYLLMLNLRRNALQGTIPNIFTNESKLETVDLSENKLEGRLPRSLENCKSLQLLDLGYNFIEDVFPFWLGALSELQVLILRFNKFHGIIKVPSKIKVNFPKLRIIDLSYNSFSGDLPHHYFQGWSAMKEAVADPTSIEGLVDYMWVNYWFSIQMTNKGVKMEYGKVMYIFYAIDLSSNMFRGIIPDSIKSLSGLQLLNLSNNELSGVIPPSMGNLIHLEALDLSSNKLSGTIPQDLVRLNFLEFLNVSNNNLTGSIPQGRQFGTFLNDSYMGNQALCGFPLSMKCGDLKAPEPSKVSFEKDTESNFPNGIDWVIILIGFVSGLVIGLVCGNHLTTRYHKWIFQRFRK